jgi:hypothetical protein
MSRIQVPRIQAATGAKPEICALVNKAQPLKANSSLVRRLVLAESDPAKRRVREWLVKIDDERLLSFGLTSPDIAILRQISGLTRFPRAR